MRIIQLCKYYSVDPSIFYALKGRQIIKAPSKWTPAGEDYRISERDDKLLQLARYHPNNTSYLPVKPPFYRFLALVGPFMTWAEMKEMLYARHLLMLKTPYEAVVRSVHADIRAVTKPYLKEFKAKLTGWWRNYARIMQLDDVMGTAIVEAYGFMYGGFEVKAFMDIITLTTGSAEDMRDVLVNITSTPMPVHYVFIYAFLYNDWGLMTQESSVPYTKTLPYTLRDYYDLAVQFTPAQMLATMGLLDDRQASTEAVMRGISNELMKAMSDVSVSGERRRREYLDMFLRVRAAIPTFDDTARDLQRAIKVREAEEADLPIIKSVDSVNDARLINPHVQALLNYVP